MLINGIKFACNTCIKGHRSSSCNHVERPLFEIRKKGRPVTQCAYCRDLRKTRQIHIKCSCTDKNKNSCYQCPSKQPYPTPSLAEDQGVSYNDIILSSSLLTQDQNQMQCTCHETAKTLLASGNNPIQSNGAPSLPLSEVPPPPPSFQSKEKEFAWISPEKVSTTATPNRPRNSFDDSSNNNSTTNYYALQRSHSSSLRFLEGQTKSPRRRSSLSRKLSSKKSSTSTSSSSSSSVTATATAMITTTTSDNLNDNNATENNFSMTPNNMMSDYSENEDAMFIDMQTFDYGVMSTTNTTNTSHPHFITETDPAEIITVPSSTTMNNHNNNNHSLGGGNGGGGGGDVVVVGNGSYHFSSSSSESMTTTSTTSSIIEEEQKQKKKKKKQDTPMSYEDFNLTNTDPNELTTLLTNVLTNEDNKGGRFEYMESSSRSSVDMTRTSTTSSSSGVLAPRAANVCGSLTPHTNCCPPIDTQGQSVVITITPLSSLFTEGGSEQVVDNRFKSNTCSQQPIPITRIVTCYCGSSCSCPGCFVHPDNYLMCPFPTPSLPFQPSSSTTYYHHQPTALSSSTSSSYSSDDEDHHNYSAYATSTFY